MLFNSIEFPIFFTLVLGAYWLLRERVRGQNALLLLSSYVFYGWWDHRFLFLIVLSSAIDFFCGLMMGTGKVSAAQRGRASIYLVGSALIFVTLRWDAIGWQGDGLGVQVDWGSLLPGDLRGWGVFLGVSAMAAFANVAHPLFAAMKEDRRRFVFLWTSIVSNLTILGFFKYFNFFAENFQKLLESGLGYSADMTMLNIVLPVGISFYTFQTMSYSIDVYRRELEPSRSLMQFAAYVAFFPQLVAGPIERGKHLLPQFSKGRSVTRDDVRSGTWLIGWGLFKKIYVADNLASIVNYTFRPYDSMSVLEAPEDGLRVLIAIYAFAFQIYADFSGYTDIARGTARLLGFDIMLNFNLPYCATSPSSFWRRWHISLSSWLRDYLYIPLGGNKKGPIRTYINLMITMLLGGLWHGAQWNFVLWGAYQGGLLAVYRIFDWRTERKKYAVWVVFLQWFVMFHFICLGWLIFRAQNITTVGLFLESIVLHPHWSSQAALDFWSVIRFIWFLVLIQIIQGATGELNPMAKWHWFLRLHVWVYIIMSIITFMPREASEFIYFAF
jgi:D-alanyl-lipoteichoic acid acyltransferase DltB (MBOAT superfamily)